MAALLLCVVWRGVVWRGVAWRGVVWCGVVSCGVVWCGVVWCGVVWCGVVWCGVVWRGVVWCGVVWCGVVWCGVVWCGVVWCGVVWCGVVWCGVVWCGVVWCFLRFPWWRTQSICDQYAPTGCHDWVLMPGTHDRNWRRPHAFDLHAIDATKRRLWRQGKSKSTVHHVQKPSWRAHMFIASRTLCEAVLCIRTSGAGGRILMLFRATAH